MTIQTMRSNTGWLPRLPLRTTVAAVAAETEAGPQDHAVVQVQEMDQGDQGEEQEDVRDQEEPKEELDQDQNQEEEAVREALPEFIDVHHMSPGVMEVERKETLSYTASR